jgi:transcriptional regulator with XRE-family HTH domain
MSPIEHIRREVFQVSQAVFGEIAGTTQASVSRWEAGDQEPGLEEMARIRAEAHRRQIAWDDRWFFEAPGPAEPEPARAVS